MTISRSQRRPPPFGVGILTWLIAVAAALALPSPAHAICLENPDPAIRALQTLAEEDANQAIKKAELLLREEQRSAHPDELKLASLYSLIAQSFSLLELDVDARREASLGLQHLPEGTNPVRLALMTVAAENVYDAAGIDAALKTILELRSAEPAGSRAEICLQITEGLLQHRQDHADRAIFNLTQAYRGSMAEDLAEVRVEAATALATVMLGVGDYDQALTLNQETLDWNIAHHATLSLSVSRFHRGQILMTAGRTAEAIDQFQLARTLSVSLHDDQGVAFADMYLCEAQIDLNALSLAKPACDNALRIFRAAGSTDVVKETQVQLARIDLEKGQPRRALTILDSVLDHAGADVPPHRVANLYLWRAQANAALFYYPAAFSDLNQYVRRKAAVNDAERTQQVAALRMRFDTDREIERNAALKRELAGSEERLKQQSRQLRWNMLVFFSGAMVIALLAYMLFSNLRYRRELQRLASQDSLTGLPNRRRTAELAMQALTDATTAGEIIGLAIIDLDHFKITNDRYGHAVGDYVLQQFARVGRDSLRDVDILGRWGGEEFLCVMPQASLEMALAGLERMRTLLTGIRLPATGAGLRVTVSAGLAMTNGEPTDLDALIARADSALYHAKKNGRDLVCIADEEGLTTASSGIRRALRR
jgi:diguanylate cyclase (GGDEF)-like protein